MACMVFVWILFFAVMVVMMSQMCLPSLQSDQTTSKSQSFATIEQRFADRKFKQVDIDTLYKEKENVAHQQRREVIVLGMHRSGTSLITGLIARMGLFTGKTLGSENTGKANPKVCT